MRNPFPGMNPYLEQSELWHQVHNRLIVAIADNLTPRIVPKYRVSIDDSQPVKPPLPAEEVAWVAEILGQSDSQQKLFTIFISRDHSLRTVTFQWWQWVLEARKSILLRR
jgi:hypothetical protein